MHVLYDLEIFQKQSVGGISRYFSELIRNYKSRHEIELSFPYLYSSNVYLKDNFPPTFLLNHLLQLKFRGKGKIEKLINHFSNQTVTRQLEHGNYDLYHPTFFDSIPPNKSKPYVITVYDMIHELFFRGTPLFEQLAWKNSEHLIRNATRIIAISESTKKDLVNIYKGLDPDKVDVIYLSNSQKEIKSDMPPIVADPYILFVGRRAYYKNFIPFLEAVAPLLSKNLRLVCIGYEFTKEEQVHIQTLNVTNFVHVFYATEEQLTNFYQNALAFFFPSLYEGFGIPILEAFACGCPTAVSNTSSLPEVGGDAVITFDPESKESIRAVTEKLLSDSTLRTELVSRGYERLKLFSWQKCADETLDTYLKALA